MSTTTHLHHTIVIEQDPHAESPRVAYDNLGILVGSHRRYEITDPGSYVNGDAGVPEIDYDAFESWAEVEAHLRAEHGAVEVLPVYLLDHGVQRYSTTPFADRWDSGQIGLIFATEATIEAIGTPRERVAEVLAREVEEYDHWVNGGYVSYRILNPAGEEIESLYGIYGEGSALAEARSTVEAILAREDALVDAWASLVPA